MHHFTESDIEELMRVMADCHYVSYLIILCALFYHYRTDFIHIISHTM